MEPKNSRLLSTDWAVTAPRSTLTTPKTTRTISMLANMIVDSVVRLMNDENWPLIPILVSPLDRCSTTQLILAFFAGLKNYIATENMGIDTSAALVRRLFGRSIELGRRYARSKNDADLFEALRLLGTGCHCLEDYSAHSNYTELALIELGETEVFPHVGRRTQMRLPGARHPVYPIITGKFLTCLEILSCRLISSGTFGGVDFLHSVMVCN